jgi:hypothetical protein
MRIVLKLFLFIILAVSLLVACELTADPLSPNSIHVSLIFGGCCLFLALVIFWPELRKD